MTTQSAKQQQGTHTPGPWRVLALDWRSDATGRISAGIATDKEPPHFVSCDSMSIDPMADARRIVACVNACEGMRDPAQEVSALRSRSDDVPAMCAEVDSLRAEVAALRTALTQLLAAADTDGCRDGYAGIYSFDDTIEQARAALGAKS